VNPKLGDRLEKGPGLSTTAIVATPSIARTEIRKRERLVSYSTVTGGRMEEPALIPHLFDISLVRNLASVSGHDKVGK
jgi:hypothetical protein